MNPRPAPIETDALARAARGIAADLEQTFARVVPLAMRGRVSKAVGQFMADADPAALLAAALARVEALIRSEPFITMRVAPAQEAALRAVLARLGTTADWPLNVAVTTDPALPDGGCVVSTASGTLEIGLDAQLAAFRNAVERGGLAAASGARG